MSAQPHRQDAELDATAPFVRCAECGRAVEFEAITERWTYWSDGVGELHPYCPECAAREFGLPPSREAGEGTSG